VNSQHVTGAQKNEEMRINDIDDRENRTEQTGVTEDAKFTPREQERTKEKRSTDTSDFRATTSRRHSFFPRNT